MTIRTVTLPPGAKHTHGDVTYYGPCTIELPESDAIWLSEAVIDARIATREKAKRIPSTSEAKAEAADTTETDKADA